MLPEVMSLRKCIIMHTYNSKGQLEGKFISVMFKLLSSCLSNLKVLSHFVCVYETGMQFIFICAQMNDIYF